MKTARLLIVSLVLLPAWLRAESAFIEKAKGTVEQRAPDAVEWELARPGEKLAEGASVRTGPKSEAELTLARGHSFRLKAGTVFQLSKMNAAETQGKLEKGRVLSRVKKLAQNEKFGIQTPTAVCAVRGTIFEAIVDKPERLEVHVKEGIVAVGLNSTGEERAVFAGQSLLIEGGAFEAPRSGVGASGRDAALEKAARHEVSLDMSRAEVLAAAAQERRLADYQEGKSLIDVNGERVRIEEYIMRPAANQFKFVVLNERANERLDYFFYRGTFNRDLPTDLSIALRDLSGKLGSTAPDYYLTSYEMAQSNTQDSLRDTASGGHLVSITRNASGDYVLVDAADAANTRTIEDAELLGDGSYKVYNPISDSFSTVTASQLSGATDIGLYNPADDTFRNFAVGDTFWKTRFNSYTHALNGISKITYTATTAGVNVLASTLDANYTYAGGFVLPVVEVSASGIDATITNYYGDGTYERYRTVLIDDNGAIAPIDAFTGVSTGAAYKGELLKWNYQQQVTATEFGGRKIDLVVEPKIFIKSGLIQ
jgi:hypothetical protein